MTEPIARPFNDFVPDLGDDPSVQLAVSASGSATVLLNRPEKKNAFNAATIAGLHQAFETLHGADTVRVVFLRGAGGTFSAGGDLDWMRSQAEASEADNRADALGLARMLKALHDVPALTVALVQGAAMGGGAGLVAACDMAVATPEASFAFSEVRLGLTPATISPYVVQAVGPRRARALFATGRRFGAEEALRFGLIDEIAPDLDSVQERLAGEMAACAPGAVGEAKRLVDLVHGARIDRGLLEETARRIAARRASAEGREGTRAFLERRKPVWAEEEGP
ncbi:MAG: enoyl-CoA hydratase-related protein [Pseudomonadota bacterium]|nr:enoyl-CoA hydratase-related protein [Pseudomonadota bacterium]